FTSSPTPQSYTLSLHDALPISNAVATVIYTNSLRPVVAVVWSGFCNLMGVLTSSGAVAFGIVALLPVELVLNVGSGAGFAMVFADRKSTRLKSSHQIISYAVFC